MKKDNKFKVLKMMAIVLFIVFIISIIALILGDFFAANIDVIGIRIAVLIVSFASFGSSTLFSLLVYTHNKTVSTINDDSNQRAELFRELQFASSNYSIIDFTDRMLIYEESSRYINRFLSGKTPNFHMIEMFPYKDPITYKFPEDANNFEYYTIRIPFKILEGKMVSSITLDEIRFERGEKRFRFLPQETEKETLAYILYNEKTKRNNLIVNIAVHKDSEFFHIEKINTFTKIKIYINVTSVLGVKIKGVNELYFTNPNQAEGDGLHGYNINSSNFTLLKRPKIADLSYIDMEEEE